MGFLPPLLIGAAVGSVVTWYIDRRRQFRWVRRISRKGGATPVTSRQSTAPQESGGTPPPVVNTPAERSNTAAPLCAASAGAVSSAPTGTVPAAVAPPRESDQLEEINGIGPVFATRLREAGIKLFADLAALTPERIVAIVTPDHATGEHHLIDPQDWIRQAQALAQESSPQ